MLPSQAQLIVLLRWIIDHHLYSRLLSNMLCSHNVLRSMLSVLFHIFQQIASLWTERNDSDGVMLTSVECRARDYSLRFCTAVKRPPWNINMALLSDLQCEYILFTQPLIQALTIVRLKSALPQLENLLRCTNKQYANVYSQAWTYVCVCVCVCACMSVRSRGKWEEWNIHRCALTRSR